MNVLSLYNLKGGVGKTASAVNLAYLAASQGKRVLLWDLDPQGASSWYLRIKSNKSLSGKKLVKGKQPIGEAIQQSAFARLDVMSADFSYRHLDSQLQQMEREASFLKQRIAPLSERYSLLILDCPPSISALSRNIIHASDTVLTPLIPSELSLNSYQQVLKFLKKEKIKPTKLQAFFSMVDRRKKRHQQWLMEPPEVLQPMLNTYIPYASVVEEMGQYRAPLEQFAPTTPAAASYRALWREVENLLRD